MNRRRFSLLLLESREQYFEDFSVIYVPKTCTSYNYEQTKQHGRLKFCSKSLLFEPNDFSKPLLKIAFKDISILEKCKSRPSFVKNSNLLIVMCEKYAELLENNIIRPYKYQSNGKFLFILYYTKVDCCLENMEQLLRASTLPPSQQQYMISAIVRSKILKTKLDRLDFNTFEKIKFQVYGHKINPLTINPGIIVVTDRTLYFQSINSIENENEIKIHLAQIEVITKRRFLLKNIGLEIHWEHEINQKGSIYLTTDHEQSREDLYNTILSQNNVKVDNNNPDILTLKWQNKGMSNYDYLMYLNSLADRTKMDLTQYPVFPWVLSDYESYTLDWNDENIYRDLSKPIGALNETRLAQLMERFNSMTEDKFIYGSHYSTPGFVIFYLVRQFPNYVLYLQNGKFDLPDRMFNSISEVYQNCLNNKSDFKELIPEFYDIDSKGEFLVNNLMIDFGYRHCDGQKIGDVKLPNWAKSPEDFVYKMRQALESDYVSEHLHLWIDLIFGYKQRGPEALAAFNVFHPVCYEGNIDLDKVTDFEQKQALKIQIMEFGQIPKQLFFQPHPKRSTSRNLLSYNVPLYQNYNERKIVNNETFDLNTTIACNMLVYDIKICQNLKEIMYLGSDCKLKIYSLQQKHQVRNYRIASRVLSACIQLDIYNIVVLACYNNIIYIFNLDTGRIVESLEQHTDAVSCLAWAKKKKLLASGSWNSMVIIWENIIENDEISRNYRTFAKFELDSNITCIDFDKDNEYLAVGAEDGTIIIWSVANRSVLYELENHQTKVNKLAFSTNDFQLISCSLDGFFWVVDYTKNLKVSGKRLKSYACSFVFLDDFLLLGATNGCIYVWDLVNSCFSAEIPAHDGSINLMDISNDGKYMITNAGKSIKVWNILY